MLKKMRSAKLSLHRETLRSLEQVDLYRVVGGETGIPCIKTLPYTCLPTDGLSCKTCWEDTCFNCQTVWPRCLLD